MSLSDGTIGHLRPTRTSGREAWYAILIPLCYWDTQIRFGLKRAGSLTQLRSAAYATQVATRETGGLWNCCQETQVYQGQIRTHFPLEQIETFYESDLKMLSEPPSVLNLLNLHFCKWAKRCFSPGTCTNCCLWLNSAPIWISKVPWKVERVETLSFRTLRG